MMSAGLASLSGLVATSLTEAEYLAAVRARVRQELPAHVDAIDREGVYPRAQMAELGRAGTFSAHLDAHTLLPNRSIAAAVGAMAEVGAECMSTAFCTWCQDASGWYLEHSPNTALRETLQGGIATGSVMAGTGMSNPMKTLAGLEGFKLKAQRAEGGYVVSGVLPWVSNLGDGQWFATVLQDAADARHLMFAMVQCGQPGVEIRQNAHFIALEGTGTYSVLFKKAFIADAMLLADPVSDEVKRILPGVILLQAGMGLGVVRGCIGTMQEANHTQAKSNQYLPRGPSYYEEACEAMLAEVTALSATPIETAPDYMRRVLEARLAISELALDAGQSAMLHAGSRGYLQGSSASRRIRESYFVAIVTPSIRHLRKELAMLGQH